MGVGITSSAESAVGESKADEFELRHGDDETVPLDVLVGSGAESANQQGWGLKALRSNGNTMLKENVRTRGDRLRCRKDLLVGLNVPNVFPIPAANSTVLEVADSGETELTLIG